MRHLFGVLTAAMLVAGCTAYSTFDPLQTSGALLGTQGTVTVKAVFVPGGYMDPPPVLIYRTAAVVPNHNQATVDHLKVSLFSMDGETETPFKDAKGEALVLRVTAADAAAGVSVPGLSFGKSFRLKAEAYGSASATESISVPATLTFTLDKLKPTAEITIKLNDVPFNGEMSPTIEITPSGELFHDGQPIVVETPMPG